MGFSLFMEDGPMTPQDAANTDDQGKPAPRILSPNRRLIDPNPKTIDELIPHDHKARLVWSLVEDLDLTSLYDEIQSVEGHPGRPAIDPRMLVALWLYATDEHIASAHELERRCIDCDPYKWICGGVHVNYHTLSDFRVQHPDWLGEQVVNHIAAMRAEGLTSLNKLGQDGMRVRANAGSGSFKSAEKLDQLRKEAEQQWDQLQDEFEQDEQLSPRRVAARKRAARERRERIRQAQKEVKKVVEQRERRKKGGGQTARASATDPESRKMKMGDGGYRPAYNVEFATDLDSLTIVGADVVNAGTDLGQMEPMVAQIEAEQEPLPSDGEYYVDGGFTTQEDIEKVSERGLTLYAPVKVGSRQKREGTSQYAARPSDKKHVATWRKRMGTPAAQEKYKQRSKTEFPNATSRNRGLHQFLVRGLKKVKTVVMWYVLIHNLHRMDALRAERRLQAA
jgi:transposase